MAQSDIQGSLAGLPSGLIIQALLDAADRGETVLKRMSSFKESVYAQLASQRG